LEDFFVQNFCSIKLSKPKTNQYPKSEDYGFKNMLQSRCYNNQKVNPNSLP